jgi:hypothetical protein
MFYYEELSLIDQNHLPEIETLVTVVRVANSNLRERRLY